MAKELTPAELAAAMQAMGLDVPEELQEKIANALEDEAFHYIVPRLVNVEEKEVNDTATKWQKNLFDLASEVRSYVKADEKKAIADIEASSSLGRDLAAYMEEYLRNESLEAQLAHDADQLELMLVLRHLADAGNAKAWEWFERCEKRLKTEIAKLLAEEIRVTPSDAWWSRLV